MITNEYNRVPGLTQSQNRPLEFEPQNQNEVDTDVSYVDQADDCTNKPMADTQKHQLLSFLDENPSYLCEVDSTMDPTRGSSDDPDASLANFFERPVKIREIVWPVNGDLDVKIQPWNLWFTNKRVANRLSNFRLFRGNLNVKFMINGNSFNWGSAMASYYPLPNSQRSPFYYSDINYKGDLMAASQRPHILLDPTTNSGGQMKLPFFWDEDNYDMINGNMSEFGDIWIASLAKLYTLSSTAPVNIAVYAWVTDIVLSGPTQTNLNGLSPQADEFDNSGPISKPAAIVEKIAGKLESVPAIKPYAMATKMAAGAVGSIASKFGYSRPRQIENPMLYKNTQSADLATIDAVDTSAGLAFNAKREVSLDPRMAGLGDTDELAFDYLANKESWLFNAPWNTADLAKTRLLHIPVTPMLANVDARTIPSTQNGVNLIPAGFVAAPFRYWRGTMVVRFQFVGSAYHKGRVLVQWDPSGFNGSAPVEQNVSFAKVVDISSQRDFEIEVGWGSPINALQTAGIPPANTYSLTPVYNPNLNFHNGVVRMSVDTRLAYMTTSTDPASFNVFVRFKDLEVYGPDSDQFNFYAPFPVGSTDVLANRSDEQEYVEQAETTIGDAKIQHDVNAPTGAPSILEKGGTYSPGSSAFAHGDPIQSFRQALKRFCFQNAYAIQETATPNNFNFTSIGQKMRPLFRGKQPGGIHTNPLLTGGSANISPTTMFAWVGMCYAGMRGSVRYKVFSHFDPRWEHWMRVSRLGANGDWGVFHETVPYSTQEVNLLELATDESFAGRQLTTKTMSHVLEYEVPYYTPRRFYYPYTNPADDEDGGHRVEIFSMSRPSDVVESRSYIVYYVAGGDDINFFFFRGVPTLYFYDTRPT